MPDPLLCIHAHDLIPWQRALTLFYSSCESVVLAGDGNCFYRAFLAAVLEGLCQDPFKGDAMLSALEEWHCTLAHGVLPGDHDSVCIASI